MDTKIRERKRRLVHHIVMAGGGVFVGIQEGVETIVDDLVLFDLPNTRITCAIPLAEISIRKVREKVAAKKAEFGIPENNA